MTHEDKDLLIKDLCARLPYEVKCYGFQMKIDNNDNECYGILKGISNNDFGWKFILNNRVPLNGRKCYQESYSDVKPYLFPLSSISEEQKEEYSDLVENQYRIDGNGNVFTLQDFYCKYHIDYRDLIPKNLAIDCTNLNIY